MYFIVPMITPCRVRLVLVLLAELGGGGQPDAGVRRRRRRAADGALLGGLIADLGDAEVEHLDAAGLGHEDVVGLEVAVDDALLVGDDERLDHRHHQLDDAGRGQALAAGHQLGERRAREELEHHVRLLRDLADLVDDDDVLVAAARGGAGLDDEALGQLGVVRLQDLDRDLAAELGVAGQVHRAHAARADLADDLVLVDLRAGARHLARGPTPT
jgi:hypothetical protein